MKVSVKLEGFTGEQDQTVRIAIAAALDGLFPECSKTFEGLGRDKAYWQSRTSPVAASVEALQGCITGYAIDPLESAIESTTRIMREEGEHAADIARTLSDRPTTSLYRAMGEHLDRLLALQLKQLNEPTVPDRDAILVSHLNEMTSKLQALVNVTKATSAV